MIQTYLIVTLTSFAILVTHGMDYEILLSLGIMSSAVDDTPQCFDPSQMCVLPEFASRLDLKSSR